MKIVAKDFVDHLLVVNVNDRYTCEQALNHPWLKVLIFFFFNEIIFTHIPPLTNFSFFFGTNRKQK